MPTAGYYRFPAIHRETLVFASEDDLWTVPAEGGIARRLTASPGVLSFPTFSPDGATLAFTGREEGHAEVYSMPSGGGPVRRVTYLGAMSSVVGWTADGSEILFTSTAGQPFGVPVLHSVRPEGGMPRPWPIGPAVSISITTGNRTVLGRNNNDPARWKRYRGGTAGELWVDAEGNGGFRRLTRLNGNVARPMWLGERIYFLSDHEGIGNLYSCLPTGEDLRRHTHRTDFFARYPNTDGTRIVYHAGADLYLFDPRTGTERRVEVAYHSPRTQRQRKFVDAARYLESYAPHPKGHSLALTARGKSFTMGNWEGAVTPQESDLWRRGDGGDGATGRGEGHSGSPPPAARVPGPVTSSLPVASSRPVRYRLTRWLPDGERVVTVTDAGGEERLEVHTAPGATGGPGRRGDGETEETGRRGEEEDRSFLPVSPSPRLPVSPSQAAAPSPLEGLDIGRPYAMRVSPVADELVLNNHRQELVFVDLAEQRMQVVDHSPFRHIMGLDWSPDGRWVAYGCAISQYQTALKLWDRTTGAIHTLTEPILHDLDPVFDPEGKYLYFLAQRDLNPVYDRLHFDLSFPRGIRPFLITLRADLLSPFTPVPRPLQGDREGVGGRGLGVGEGQGAGGPQPTPNPQPPTPVVIDLEGIAQRVVAFPVPEGIYGQIAAIPGKALFSAYPVEGALPRDRTPGEPEAKGTLEVYDFEAQKHEPLIPGITDFQLSQDGKTLFYRAGNKLRALKAGEKPDEKLTAEPPSRRSGWIHLGRVRVSIDPGVEWRQMAGEAWRLQREHFWTSDMSQVNWKGVWERYAPLIERVGTRGEFSDLMWEMQGELGTSHAYEAGGDYRPEPQYPQGFLGADFVYDAQAGAYRIARIVQGAPGEPEASSPLMAPGVNVRPGDRLKAINGRRLAREIVPQELLVHQADTEVTLTVEGEDGKTREVTVKALKSEMPARYREWVETNRRRVHEASGGRAGYVHIPDMGARGYAEFHRLYLAEVAREALIVDVRYNGGGHVSELLIEKLARRRVGYDVSRWGQPMPYPSYSVAGPMVAICNQWAGSDGDIFSHVFKLKKLGPLVGKRTWGGVIGIWPRNPLADGSFTTQPEFSFWFQDVGWGVENYGTDPDVEVDIAPQEYARGEDPQLDRALALLLERLEAEPPATPSFADRPNLAPPLLIVPPEEG